MMPYDLNLSARNKTLAPQFGMRLLLFSAHVVQEKNSSPACVMPPTVPLFQLVPAGTQIDYRLTMGSVANGSPMRIFARVAANSASPRAWHWLGSTGLPSIGVRDVGGEVTAVPPDPLDPDLLQFDWKFCNQMDADPPSEPSEVTPLQFFYYEQEGADPDPSWDPLESTCRHASLSIL